MCHTHCAKYGLGAYPQRIQFEGEKKKRKRRRRLNSYKTCEHSSSPWPVLPFSRHYSEMSEDIFG